MTRKHADIRRILAFAAAVLALAAALLALAGCGGGTLEDEVGDEQPVFTNLNVFDGQTLGGAAFTEADFEPYDATIINVWATWCPPCRAEMPDLAAYAKALPDNVNFITVCVDGADEPEVARQILADAGFEGATLVSGDGDLAELVKQVQSLPTTIVVDNRGSTYWQYIIGSPTGHIQEYYDTLLQGALEEFGA